MKNMTAVVEIALMEGMKFLENVDKPLDIATDEMSQFGN